MIRFNKLTDKEREIKLTEELERVKIQIKKLDELKKVSAKVWNLRIDI